MQRAVTTGLVGCAFALALVATSCAKGNDPTPSNGSDVTPVVAGDAGADGAVVCPPCAAGEMCSGGQCMSGDVDQDGDGFKLRADCNDNDPAIHPGAAEICNGKDDNCDGKIDEGFDTDGDGYVSCTVGTSIGDCDDKDPTVHPGALEVCNNKDDNCDGKVDEGFDKDNDGYYTCPHGALPIPVDCDDTDPKIHPGAVEICNGKDDDCNGKIDEIPATLTGALATPVDPHWALRGSTVLSAVGGATWAQLTPDLTTYQSGGLWWNAPYTFDAFDVTATFWIENKSDGADGMAFAWVPGSTAPGVGQGGLTYGAGNLGGYSVAIDTFANAGEPAAPFIGIGQNGAAPAPVLKTSISNVRDGANHILRVKLDPPGNITVWVDGAVVVPNFAIPGYSPFSGHWGFTGGTGGATEAHWVKDITMSFPLGQGCVP